jgi:putative membrane protein
MTTLRVDERLRGDLVAAVQRIEKASAAEVVVTVVPRAAGHWDVTLAATLGVVLAAQLAAAALLGDVTALGVLIDAVVAAAVAVAVVRVFPVVQRVLLPRRAAVRRVEQGAESAFFRQGIYRTRGRTGVLLYLAVLERRAVLLPDDAVVHALPPATLAALRTQADGVLAGRDPRAALLTLLDQLGRAAARHLPAGPGDLNELPDAPVMP